MGRWELTAGPFVLGSAWYLLGLLSALVPLIIHLSRSRRTVLLPAWSRKDQFTFAEALALGPPRTVDLLGFPAIGGYPPTR